MEFNKIRLEELRAKKKLGKGNKGLTDEEFKEFKELCSLEKKLEKNSKVGNPFASYNKFPELTADAGKIAMNYLPGTRFAEDRSIFILGALGIPFFPVAGNEHSDQGGLNISDRDTWLKLHRKYRGLERYQSADVGIIFVATKDLFLLLGEVDRIYGVINHYDRLNRNVPDVLLRALGVNSDLAADLRLHLADFRLAYNKLIQRAQLVLLPKDLSIVQEGLSLVSFVYADSSSKYQQAIVFTAKAYGIYAPNDIISGGAVRYEVPLMESVSPAKNAYNWCSNFHDYGDIIAYVEERITALVGDDDVQRIYSDMNAGMYMEDMMGMSPLAEDWEISPVEDKSILNKFHNMDVVDGECDDPLDWHEEPVDDFCPASIIYQTPGDYPGAGEAIWHDSNSMSNLTKEGRWYIYQCDNVIITSLAICPRTNRMYSEFAIDGRYMPGVPTANQRSVAGVMRENGESILDILDDDPKMENIWEGCMWKFATKQEKFTGTVTHTPCVTYTLTSNGTELMSCMIGFSRTNDGHEIYNVFQNAHAYTGGSPSVIGTEFLQADWSPARIGYRMNTAGNYEIEAYGGEIQTARLIHRDQYYRIHDISMLSLWHTEIRVKE